ncbi:glycosyltransferase family 2 protein [Kitasatospora sp. NBC_01302]|uniref:glycosyltransferase family 2 protein n=1 Tax=unclassified Kitasatospora TaxID=2633591 RepID=UPI003FA39F12
MSPKNSTATASRRRGTPARRSQPPAWRGLLPQPPDDQEKYSYAKRHVWVLTVLSVVCFGCLAVSQFRFSSSSPWFWIFAPFLALISLDYLISLRLDSFTHDFDLRAHRRRVLRWKPSEYPSVDIFLPVCGEPIEVLHNTWTHVRRLSWQYPGIARPYVLDDSDNPQIAAMAEDFGFRYVVRPDRGRFKKAGNLNHALGLTEGEYVLILDADFAPRSDLLEELLPYLATDPSAAIAQSPQFFRILDQQNWIERGAGSVQELFYRSVQVSRQRSGGAICVGSCAVYRRSALLEVGGITLIDHSEDIYTGFDLAARGYTLQYVPVPLSTGVCPDSVASFQNQQYRWCAGSLSLVTSKRFWETELAFNTRLCFISGFLHYLQTALFTLLAPLIPIFLLLLRPDLLRAEQTVWLLPSVLYTAVALPLWHRNPYRLEAWAVRQMYGWAHVFAIWDQLRGREIGWKPTGSAGARQTRPMRRFWIGMYGWCALTALLWVGGAVWRLLTLYPPDFALVFSGGLFYACVVGRVLIQPRTQEALS